jgi:hypothetical protein
VVATNIEKGVEWINETRRGWSNYEQMKQEIRNGRVETEWGSVVMNDVTDVRIISGGVPGSGVQIFRRGL